MIKLEVEEYCHNCPHFKPEVKNIETFYFNMDKQIEQHVTCKHCEICAQIAEHIKNKIKRRIDD